MANMNNIAGISVATSANNNNQNNNIETLKGMIIAGHDGAKDFGSGEYGLTFGFKWGEYNIFVSRSYGMWLVSLYKNYKSEWTSEGRKISYDAQILDRRLGNYARGKRWSMSLAENMAEFILDTIADYEQEQELNNTTDRYQSELDGYVEDLKGIANKATDINTAIGIAASTLIVKKLEQLNKDYIKSLEEITGWTDWADIYDHYTLDWDAFAEWLDAYGTWDDGEFICDFDAIKGNINSLIVKMNMPLGIDKETLDFELGGYEDETSFLGLVADYPSYIWDGLRDFISTYYHYAYCA